MDKTYYQEMLRKDRLIPFFHKDELVCFITFYITDNPEKYLRDNMWSVEDDNENGSVCWVDQLWSNKKAHQYSFGIWGRLVNFIKENYPLVKTIRWNRWKNEKVFIFNKEIR